MTIIYNAITNKVFANNECIGESFTAKVVPKLRVHGYPPPELAREKNLWFRYSSYGVQIILNPYKPTCVDNYKHTLTLPWEDWEIFVKTLTRCEEFCPEAKLTAAGYTIIAGSSGDFWRNVHAGNVPHQEYFVGSCRVFHELAHIAECKHEDIGDPAFGLNQWFDTGVDEHVFVREIVVCTVEQMFWFSRRGLKTNFDIMHRCQLTNILRAYPGYKHFSHLAKAYANTQNKTMEYWLEQLDEKSGMLCRDRC